MAILSPGQHGSIFEPWPVLRACATKEDCVFAMADCLELEEPIGQMIPAGKWCACSRVLSRTGQNCELPSPVSFRSACFQLVSVLTCFYVFVRLFSMSIYLRRKKRLKGTTFFLLILTTASSASIATWATWRFLLFIGVGKNNWIEKVFIISSSLLSLLALDFSANQWLEISLPPEGKSSIPKTAKRIALVSSLFLVTALTIFLFMNEFILACAVAMLFAIKNLVTSHYCAKSLTKLLTNMQTSNVETKLKAKKQISKVMLQIGFCVTLFMVSIVPVILVATQTESLITGKSLWVIDFGAVGIQCSASLLALWIGRYTSVRYLSRLSTQWLSKRFMRVLAWPSDKRPSLRNIVVNTS